MRFVALLPVRRRRGVVGHEDRRNTAEELIHMDMCFDPGTFLLIDECFDEGILAVGHNADKDPGICDLAGSPAQSTSICSPGFLGRCIVAFRFCSFC